VCPNCHGATIPQNANQCPSCRQLLPEGASKCPHCNRAIVDSLVSANEIVSPKPIRLWYLVAFLFGLIGGLVGYISVRDKDDTMAVWLLILGGVMTAIDIAIYLSYPQLLF
jgi:hypothetical protein